MLRGAGVTDCRSETPRVRCSGRQVNTVSPVGSPKKWDWEGKAANPSARPSTWDGRIIPAPQHPG